MDGDGREVKLSERRKYEVAWRERAWEAKSKVERFARSGVKEREG